MQRHQVSWVKSRIAPFLHNQPVFYNTTLLWVHGAVYVGRESRLQWNPYKRQRSEQRHMRLRWLLHQEGRQEIDWTTKYIVFSKFESPAKVGSHNAIASIFTNYRTFLEPLFTDTHLTRNLVNYYYWQFPLSLGKDFGFSRDLTRLIRTSVYSDNGHLLLYIDMYMYMYTYMKLKKVK